MAVTVQKYDVLTIILGRYDLVATDVSATGIYAVLMNSSHGVITSADTGFAAVSTNTHDTGNGYTQFDPAGPAGVFGGGLLSGVTLVETAGLATFDATDVFWSANGGTIPSSSNAVAATLVTMVGSALGTLMFNIDFGADEQAGDGTQFKITWNSSGIYTLDSNP